MLHYYLKAEDQLGFGRYRKKTVAEVLETNPAYLVWTDDNVSFIQIDPEIISEALRSTMPPTDPVNEEWW